MRIERKTWKKSYHNPSFPPKIINDSNRNKGNRDYRDSPPNINCPFGIMVINQIEISVINTFKDQDNLFERETCCYRKEINEHDKFLCTFFFSYVRSPSQSIGKFHRRFSNEIQRNNFSHMDSIYLKYQGNH